MTAGSEALSFGGGLMKAGPVNGEKLSLICRGISFTCNSIPANPRALCSLNTPGAEQGVLMHRPRGQIPQLTPHSAPAGHQERVKNERTALELQHCISCSQNPSCSVQRGWWMRLRWPERGGKGIGEKRKKIHKK